MENGNGAKAAQDVMLLVPANVAQAILNYLQERPFKEVQGLIGELIKCGVPHECVQIPSVPMIPPRELVACEEDA
jgi:hypothetical protein